MPVALNARKFMSFRRFGGLAAAAALLSLLAAGRSFAAGPAAWQDPATGLAIGGFDPVVYFTRGAPRMGRKGLELVWGGAVWRFLNTGNRAAFERHPHVYTPRFAGYDPYSIAQGRTTRGHPAIWARHKDRIYLFHDAANFRLWQENSDAMIAEAEKKWPNLAAGLASSIGE